MRHHLFQTEYYQKEKLTIDVVKANVNALFMIIPIILIFALPFFLLWHDKLKNSGIRSLLEIFDIGIAGNIFLYLVAFFAGIVLHELIHGLTWALFTEKGFKSISFGIMKESITPYCHCKEPLRVKHYILGGIAPAILLGLIPATLSWATGSSPLLLFGIVFTIAAAGDFMIINLLRKEKMDDLAEDHPSEAGCFVYRKVNI